ncbi:hypothetical protein EMIT093MI4_50202 [Pseudomonas sp. IT-93MI4]
MSLQEPTCSDKRALGGNGQKRSDFVTVLTIQNIKIHGFRMIAPDDCPDSNAVCACDASFRA